MVIRCQSLFIQNGFLDKLLQPAVLLSIVLEPTTDNYNIVVTAAIPTRMPQSRLAAIAMPVKEHGVFITDPSRGCHLAHDTLHANRHIHTATIQQGYY